MESNRIAGATGRSDDLPGFSDFFFAGLLPPDVSFYTTGVLLKFVSTSWLFFGHGFSFSACCVWILRCLLFAISCSFNSEELILFCNLSSEWDTQSCFYAGFDSFANFIRQALYNLPVQQFTNHNSHNFQVLRYIINRCTDGTSISVFVYMLVRDNV